jgi:hypothetical protein
LILTWLVQWFYSSYLNISHITTLKAKAFLHKEANVFYIFLYTTRFTDHVIMNLAIGIAIIISAIALVGMASIAVNYYSPAPAHAQKSTNKGWCIPGTQ